MKNEYKQIELIEIMRLHEKRIRKLEAEYPETTLPIELKKVSDKVILIIGNGLDCEWQGDGIYVWGKQIKRKTI